MTKHPRRKWDVKINQTTFGAICFEIVGGAEKKGIMPSKVCEIYDGDLIITKQQLKSIRQHLSRPIKDGVKSALKVLDEVEAEG